MIVAEKGGLGAKPVMDAEHQSVTVVNTVLSLSLKNHASIEYVKIYCKMFIYLHYCI